MAINNIVHLANAHYHAIAAATLYSMFAEDMKTLATDSEDERARRDGERKRETTYSRGILGRT